MAGPPSLTLPVQTTPCSCRYQSANVQLSPSTATGGSVAHTCPLWASTSTLVGFASLAAVLLIQGDHTPLPWHLLHQPALRAVSCRLYDSANHAQTHVQPQQFLETRLDAAIAGVAFQQQRQDRSFAPHRRLVFAFGLHRR